MAMKNSSKSVADGKRQYDRKVRFSFLKPGDRVLVRNLSERGGPGKPWSFWEQQIHIVVKQNGDLPAYEVRPEGQAGKPRVLHRNLLLPCDFLSSESRETIQERRATPVNVRSQERSHDCSISESDNEEEFPGMSPTALERLQFPTTTAEQATDGIQPDYSEGPIMDKEEQELPDNAERTAEGNNPPQGDQPEQDPLTHQQSEYGPRPVRNRRTPQVLCYDQPGNPSYHPLNVSSIQLPPVNAIFDQQMYHPSYWPWGNPVLYYPPPYLPVCPVCSQFPGVHVSQLVPPVVF